MKSLLLLFLVASAASACLWDADTLPVEKARFPGLAEIQSGKFPRHSREFYEWRKADAQRRLTKDPRSAAAYDDLAVAQHKLGDQQAAIATMEAKEKAVPGQYETYSNLGTFYLYAGQLEEAHRWIEKALAINANAHFGREKYQLWLIEWVQAGKPQTSGPPVEDDDSGRRRGFAAFAAMKQGYRGKSRDWEAGRLEALGGITGMMRFADFDNPLLQEALGDVLVAGPADATYIAAMAFLFASQHTEDAHEKTRLLMKAESAHDFRIENRSLATALATSLAEGRAFAESVRKNELFWIRAGRDVAAEFEKNFLPRASK